MGCGSDTASRRAERYADDSNVIQMRRNLTLALASSFVSADVQCCFNQICSDLEPEERLLSRTERSSQGDVDYYRTQ